MAEKKSTVIIMPAYNEQDNIKDTVEKVKKVMTAGMGLVVVDDGSTDSTRPILEEMGVRCLPLEVNLGYGAAVQTGVRYALRNGYDYAVLMDSDGQHDPSDISRLLDGVKSNEADLVIGSRFVEDTGYKGSRIRRQGSIFFSNLIRLLAGKKIADPTSGFQALNREVQKIYASRIFPADYPDADMMLFLLYHNLRVKEVPVHMGVNRKKSMHSGIGKAVYYVYKMLLSILVMITLRNAIKRKVTHGY